MKWLVLALSVALAGCPAGDDAPAPDAADPPGGGLVIAWAARPEPIPGRIDNRLTLAAATLRLRDARAIGDAGGGDPRTLAAMVELRWAAAVTPPALVFPDAPTGLYARTSFDLDRGAAPFAYELTGTVEIRDVVEPFVVRDRDRLPVSFTYSVALPPGGTARVPVRVDLDAVVRALDFEAAPVVDGRRVVDGDGGQADVLRTEMGKAFGVHSP